MSISERLLNRATLDRQLLLARSALSVLHTVKRVVALQAQEAASPYLALWNRVADFNPDDLHDAYVNHQVVKASLMRITLHAVNAEDYPWFHTAMVPSLRASRLHDQRFKVTGLSIEDADSLLPEVLKFARKARTGAEFEAMFNVRVGELPKPGLWWAFRTFAPMVHHPTGGPWSFGPRPSFVRSPHGPSKASQGEAVAYLARRYLEGFGPASVADLAQFSLLTRPVIREALESLGSELVRLEGPGGVELFDIAGAQLPGSDVEAPPRLMAMWDSTLLAYADRSRVIPPDYRRLVIQNNGDVLPTVWVDGYVAGVWRLVAEGVEVTAFHKLPKTVWTALAGEAASLLDLVNERDPRLYSRYHRWWDRLGHGERRVVGR